MRIIDTLRRKRPSGWDYSCTTCGLVMSGLEAGPSIRLIRHHIATAHPELAGSTTEGFAPKTPAIRCDCDTDPSLITFSHARRHAPDAVPASWPTEVVATHPKAYGKPATALFIAPDASGELYVWGPHPTRPDLPVVLGGLPREGLFREWLLDNLPTWSRSTAPEWRAIACPERDCFWHFGGPPEDLDERLAEHRAEEHPSEHMTVTTESEA